VPGSNPIRTSVRRHVARWQAKAFSRNWRNRRPRRVLTLALTVLTTPRWLTRRDPSAYYTDVTTYTQDPSFPLWSNLGYWRDARHVIAAQEEMARLLAREVGLGPDDYLVDVGCGCADQDILWAREIGPRRIEGIDITPVRVELANRRLADAGLAERVRVIVGSATALPQADASADAVTALECAAHFRTRDAFFPEAFRVLKPGGRLALTDLAALPGRSHAPFDAWLQRINRRLTSIPDKNVYDRDEYRRHLEAAGFVEVRIRSIADHVFAGCMRYRSMLANGGTWESPVDLQPRDFEATQWHSNWHDGIGMGDYVVASARKPDGGAGSGRPGAA
jgi:microcystin synthetase protein McyJ